MIVTTSYNVTSKLAAEAHAFAHKWGWTYRKRERMSLQQMRERYKTDETIVLSREQARWSSPTGQFSFHPSLAVVRIKRLLSGDSDVLTEVAGLSRGDKVLDATLGFASDAITAAHIVGEEGQVVGLESEPRIAALVEYGLNHFPIDVPEVKLAMNRVQVKATDHMSYMEQCPDNAFDVVYFDPMFRHEISHSEAMAPLRQIADSRPLSLTAIKHARRIARKCVVLKETSGSGEFKRLGFQLLKQRPHGVAYGIIRTGACDNETA